MKRVLVVILILPMVTFGQQNMFYEPLSERIANYTITCKLDPNTKTVAGEEILTWKNTSRIPVHELRFHLYQNAFSHEKSSLLLEMPEFPEELIGHWGYCRVLKMALPDGTDLAPRLAFIQPDDGNPHDRTVCAVKLPRPVGPGEELRLFLEFETKLPPVVSRSGYEKNFFSVTQWFPKLGVFEDGHWVCHQYHSNGEFYSDFGVYDVTIIIPEEYMVGATGVRIEEKNLGNGWKRLRHYCEDIHDFAWCADPDFVEIMDRFEDTEIRFMCQPDHVAMADRFLRAVKVCFEYYGSRYGKYPYPVVTMVDTKHRDTGEMEYPTLFLTGNFDSNYEIEVYQSDPLPESDRYIEWLTIHEFGHNWWMGIVANNETDHVWVDEGINSYASTKALEYGYGKYLLKDYKGIKETAREHERNFYLKMAKAATVLQPSWLYRPGDEYFTLTYCKPEMMLHTLNNHFGEELWGKVMKTFFQRWKFKHPETEDFFEVVYEVTGKNWKRFFDEYMNTTHTVDFKVEKVEGNQVWIKREGCLRFPVKILVHFVDDSEEVREWDNIQNSVMFDFSHAAEIEYIKIDPQGIIEFELDKENNSWIK
ncbi:MAG: M1 family metallopeptidase [Candidatus Aminicenantes bacterium]